MEKEHGELEFVIPGIDPGEASGSARPPHPFRVNPRDVHPMPSHRAREARAFEAVINRRRVPIEILWACRAASVGLRALANRPRTLLAGLPRFFPSCRANRLDFRVLSSIRACGRLGALRAEALIFFGIFWSGRRDSNPRPQPWQGCALPLSYTRILPRPAG